MIDDFEIRTFVATRVAFMRVVGPYGSPRICQLWQQFGDWCTSRGLMSRERRLLGVAQDNPNITPRDQTRYDVCIEVDDGFAPDSAVAVKTLPGGVFACAPFQGTAAQIGPAWVRLLGKTLPHAGYEVELAPAIELYESGKGIDPETGVFRCLLCMPVR
jgi:AraC family transcriptional regulator